MLSELKQSREDGIKSQHVIMTLEDKLDQTYQLRDRTVNDLKKKIAELEHLGYKKDTEEPANQRA
jgi:hypothetical protein